MARLPVLRQGQVVAWATVDAADYAWLSDWKWKLHSEGYAERWEPDGRCKVLMHRAILGLDLGDRRQADHINRDRLDNRRDNLRIVTDGQNKQNIKAIGRSRYRGVTFKADMAPDRRWRARGRIDGQHFLIGYFATEDEAGVAAAAWRARHMPFAREAA